MEVKNFDFDSLIVFLIEFKKAAARLIDPSEINISIRCVFTQDFKIEHYLPPHNATFLRWLYYRREVHEHYATDEQPIIEYWFHGPRNLYYSLIGYIHDWIRWDSIIWKNDQKELNSILEGLGDSRFDVDYDDSA